MSLPFGPNQDQYIVVRVDNGKGQCIQHAVQWNPQGGQVVAYPTLKVSTLLEFCSGVGGGHEVGAEKYGRGGDAPGFLFGFQCNDTVSPILDVAQLFVLFFDGAPRTWPCVRQYSVGERLMSV